MKVERVELDEVSPREHQFFCSLNRHVGMNTVMAERASDVCTFASMEARFLYTTKCMLNPLTALLSAENESNVIT